jgi:hypothetical protein
MRRKANRPRRRGCALIASVAACWLAVAGCGARGQETACDRVASPAGSDAASGTVTSPYRSAQKLIDSVRAGQTGCLRAGTYTQPRLRFGHGGAGAAPLTLTSYPGERAKLAGGIVEIPSGSNFVRLSGLHIDGSAAVNATVWVMSYNDVIEDSDITNRNLGTQCMILGGNGWGGPSGRLLIQRNKIHDCGRFSAGNQEHAIYFENTVDTRVIDNIFWGAAGYAIHLYPNAQRTLVAHNVIVGNGRGVIFGGDDRTASSGNVVRQNLITDSRVGYNVESYWSGPIGAGNVVERNCVQKGNLDGIGAQTGFAATNNRIVEPRYLDAANNDYRLAADSPCLPTVGYDTAAVLLRGHAG